MSSSGAPLSIQGRVVRIASEPRVAPRGGYLFRGLELSAEGEYSRIFLMFQEGLARDLYDLPQLCWVGTEVAAYRLAVNNRLDDGSIICSVTPETDIILEPHRPVSVTEAVEAAACVRSVDVRFRVGPDEPFWMAKGRLVHTLFQHAIYDGSDSNAAFRKAFRSALPEVFSVLPGSDVSITDPALEQEARTHFRNLVSWVDERREALSGVEAETDRMSVRYGLKGRADAIFRGPGCDTIVELKSGRMPLPEHLLQLHAYRLLFGEGADAPEPDGVVIYSATGRADVAADLSREWTRAILEGRNRVVALRKSYLAGNTEILAEHACHREGTCFARANCRRLFGDGRTKGPLLTGANREYYDRWFRLLALETWTQDEAFSRHLDPRTLDARLAEGATIAVIEAQLAEHSQDNTGLKKSPDTTHTSTSGEEKDESHPAGSMKLPSARMLLSLPQGGLDLNRGDLVILHRGIPTGPHAFHARIGSVDGGQLLARIGTAGALQGGKGQDLVPQILRVPDGWFLDRLPFSRGSEVAGRGLFHFLAKADPPIVQLVVRGTEESEHGNAIPTAPESGEPDDVEAVEAEVDGLLPADLCYAEGLQAELNEDQEAAVEAAYASPAYHLVHGPPGTGKTRVLARLIKLCLVQGERVLVTCPTNVALDRLLLALIDLGVRDFLRIGSRSVVSQEFLAAVERLGNPPALLSDLAAAGLAAKEFRERVRSTMLVSATAYQCAAHPFFRRQRFDRVVVDEAGQLDEPSTLGPLALAPRFVLGGDHLQLPPIVQASGTTGCETDGPCLERSLFERLFRTVPHSRVSSLRVQYRMNREVQEIPSRLFYDGALVPAPEVARRRLSIKTGSFGDDDIDRILEQEHPVVFVDVPGTDGGTWRPEEASLASRLARGLLVRGLPPAELGIITPYRAQQSLIRKELSQGRHDRAPISVDTVDRFQGGEREVIILSLARTDGVTSFLADRKRLNVSLSRARSKLILLGHGPTLDEHPLFSAVLAGAERIRAEETASHPG